MLWKILILGSIGSDESRIYPSFVARFQGVLERHVVSARILKPASRTIIVYQIKYRTIASVKTAGTKRRLLNVLRRIYFGDRRDIALTRQRPWFSTRNRLRSDKMGVEARLTAGRISLI